MKTVYDAAEATGLFAENDIKVRINPYKNYKLGETKNDFMHVFGHIMEGRSIKERANLSQKIIEALNGLLPGISILSINIQEFEKATYCNKALLNPLNTTRNRHFQ